MAAALPLLTSCEGRKATTEKKAIADTLVGSSWARFHVFYNNADSFYTTMLYKDITTNRLDDVKNFRKTGGDLLEDKRLAKLSLPQNRIDMQINGQHIKCYRSGFSRAPYVHCEEHDKPHREVLAIYYGPRATGGKPVLAAWNGMERALAELPGNASEWTGRWYLMDMTWHDSDHDNRSIHEWVPEREMESHVLNALKHLKTPPAP